MANNFTMQDVEGISLVFPFFSVIFLAPGYLLGQACNVLGFRQKGMSERILLALIISAAVSPYAINILCRFLTVGAVSAIFLLLGILFLTRLLVEWRWSKYSVRAGVHWTTKAALSLAAVWMVICLLSLPDMQIGQTLYSTAASFDHAVRTSFISSALRGGAPPANPFFFGGYIVHARYYYYWNVLCALPAYMSGANSRVILYASCIWSGMLLAAIIPIYLKHFLEKRSNLRLASVIGIALIAITGLDLFPTLIGMLFSHGHPAPDMEWWDPCQITSWVDSLIWVPHHVASLVACLAGYLFLWKAVYGREWLTRLWPLAFAAIGFSSAAGLSVYVTLTFGSFVLAWMLYLLLRGSVLAATLHAAVGASALLLSIGFIGDLLGPGTSGINTGSSSRFLAFAPRQLPVNIGRLAAHLGVHNRPAEVGLWILLGFLVMFFELGIYMAVGLIQASFDWRRRRTISEAHKSLWMMAGTALVIIMCVSSTVIGTNDLGYRGALVLQFVLLLWTAVYLADRLSGHAKPSTTSPFDQKLLKACLIGLIVIGGASSLYQLCMLRVYTLLSDKYKWTDGLQLANGHDALLVRAAYQKLDRIVPANAIVQYNPQSVLANQMLIYSRYQLVDGSSPGCMTTFGGSLTECTNAEAALQAIFNPRSENIPSKGDVYQVCHKLHINVLVVNALDPVWKKEDSWVWLDTPMVQNGFVRVFWCG